MANPLTNTAVQTASTVSSAFATAPTTTTATTVPVTTTATTAPVATTVAAPVVPVDPYVALQQQHDAQRLLLDQQILAAEQKLVAEELAASTAALTTPVVGTVADQALATSVQAQAFTLAR